jgi:hypothetical protein
MEIQKASMLFNRQIKIRTLLTIALLLAFPALTKAADIYWNVTSGDWSDTNPSPWSTGIEPTSSDNAYIRNGGTATVTQAGETCFSLYLDGANTSTVQMSSGSLSILCEYVGNSGKGAFIQSAGINNVTNTGPGLYVGYQSGSYGTYLLSGQGELRAYSESIGYYGTGEFNQTGGINTISNYNYSGNYCVGYGKNATGTYNLSGLGQLSTKGATIGDNYGTGIFNQYGGTLNSSDIIYIGTWGGNGTYNLYNGQLSTSRVLSNYSCV